jgi:hypothetical protein
VLIVGHLLNAQVSVQILMVKSSGRSRACLPKYIDQQQANESVHWLQSPESEARQHLLQK